MITIELLNECAAVADQVPDRYREIAFEKLVDEAVGGAACAERPPNPAAEARRSESPTDVQMLGQLLIDAEKQDRKLLLAIRILEIESGGVGAALARIPDVFKRYRVRPPGNVPRDVSSLIRRGLVIEHGRENRKVRIILTNQGLKAIGK